VFCWGTSEVVASWPKPALQPLTIGTFGAGARLTAGRRHACVLDGNGRASCWGWNVDGETGTGSSGIAASLVATPTAVLGDHRFVSISAGSNFTCGATSTGGLLCWGNNVDGVVGDQAIGRCGDVDPVPCSARPVEIKAPEPMRQVSSGTSHACALGESGNVYCWGGNAHGQLGQVTTSKALQRVPMPGGEKFAAIASGGVETCGVTTAEVLYCWGADYRRSRQGALTNEDVAPRRVATGITMVAAGQLHFCASTRGGGARCWGDTILGAFGSR
jgi:alpha-tubulin suppressor-like RCC1 family protein